MLTTTEKCKTNRVLSKYHFENVYQKKEDLSIGYFMKSRDEINTYG